MEDLDEKPSRFHELNNALHAALAGIGVTNARLEEQARQSIRIEAAITAQTGRLDRFDMRMNEIEKNQIAVRGELERQIGDVKADVHEKVQSVTSEFKEQLALLSPVRLIVYGLLVMVLSAFANAWITNTMVNKVSQPSAVMP